MIALGYLLGITPGPLVSVVGGLALVTFGRALVLDELPALRSSAALAVIAGSLGVGALRWGTLELTELRGVQSVLGPTLLVGPPVVALACALAAAGALIALSSWVVDPLPSGRGPLAWASVEGVAAALAVVTVFFDPARSALTGSGFGTAMVEIGRWAVAVAAAAAIVGGLAYWQQRLAARWRLVVLGGSGALVIAGAVLVAGAL